MIFYDLPSNNVNSSRRVLKGYVRVLGGNKKYAGMVIQLQLVALPNIVNRCSKSDHCRTKKSVQTRWNVYSI
jgi:hypothetical protein